MSIHQSLLDSVCTPTGLAVTLACLGFVYISFLRPRLSPLSSLPGPSASSIWFGNLGEVLGSEGGAIHEEWHNRYGSVIAYRGFFGTTRMSTIDPKALNHVLVARAYAYPKPNEVRLQLGTLLGRGLLFAEGEVHKRQKRLLAPAFAPSQIRELGQVVYDEAFLLAEKWTELVRSSGEAHVVMNVMPWLSRAALDIIGSAGFGYHFGALEGDESSSKLGEAFHKLMLAGSEPTPAWKLLMTDVLRAIPPWLHLYKPEVMLTVEASLKTMEEECQALLVEKKAEAVAGMGRLMGKDLISLLVCANAANEEKDRLSDAEVIGQMTTFLFAGHETAATALTWLLWCLARNAKVQTRLRDELREAEKTGPSPAGGNLNQIPIDQLNSLTYLDAVCRETFRFLPPVPETIREAAIDDTIPIGNDGLSVKISAGEQVVISISALHRSQEFFGPDASIFRPERWLEENLSSGSPGIWAGLMTFLAGPRACIGFRFALMELKVLVAVIVCRFKIEERDGSDGGPEIVRRSAIVMRPQVKNDPGRASMPLRISLI